MCSRCSRGPKVAPDQGKHLLHQRCSRCSRSAEKGLRPGGALLHRHLPGTTCRSSVPGSTSIHTRAQVDVNPACRFLYQGQRRARAQPGLRPLLRLEEGIVHAGAGGSAPCNDSVPSAFSRHKRVQDAISRQSRSRARFRATSASRTRSRARSGPNFIFGQCRALLHLGAERPRRQRARAQCLAPRRRSLCDSTVPPAPSNPPQSCSSSQRR